MTSRAGILKARAERRAVRKVCRACMGTGEQRVKAATFTNARIGLLPAVAYERCTECGGTGNALDGSS